MDKLFPQFVLTPEQLEAIGCVAIISAYLQNYMERLVWSLCHIKESDGKFLTDRLMVDKLADLLSDIAKPRIETTEKLAIFTEIISKIKEANTERNTIIHGIWLPIIKQEKGKQKIGPGQATKRRLKSDPVYFEAEKIMTTAHKLNKIHHELYEFACNEWKQASWLGIFALPSPIPE